MSTSINRESLLKIVNLIKPALASQDYIPALTHIKFDGSFAMAYNDISAISVACSVPVQRCVPGDVLIRGLNSFNGESVALTFDAKTNALLVSSGRSKLKLPTIPLDQFPFEENGDTCPEITLTTDMLKGIELCLMSVGSDPTHAAQMGVTLETDLGGKTWLYSTDNFTVSYYKTKDTVKLPGDAPLILPTFFCQQLLALSKAHPGLTMILVLLPGALQVDYCDYGNNVVASLFTKTVIDLEPLDFVRIIDKHSKTLKGKPDAWPSIPDPFDAAFNRALLVLSAELDKSTKVTHNEKSIKLESSSKMGDSEDEFEYKGSDSGEFLIDPTLVVRASKVAQRMTFGKGIFAISAAEGAFVHMIAHCAS